MISSIISFLLFNLRIFGRPNAKIFLGDSGSTLLGFTICWLAIDTSQGENRIITPTLVLWVIAVPLIDSVCIMLRRIRKGRSPFAPDREHLHHILLLAGYSVNQILALYLVCSLSMSMAGIIASFIFNVPQGVLFMGFLLLFACHYWCMNHAWKMVKIARYLHTHKAENVKTNDRRKKGRRKRSTQLSLDISERRIMNERRCKERRYIPTAVQLEIIPRRLSKNRVGAEVMKTFNSCNDK
jgi:hypothetical protein